MYVSVYFPEGEAERFRSAVEQADVSRNKFIRESIAQRIEDDQQNAEPEVAEA